MTDTVTEFVAPDDQADPSPETATVEQKLIDQLVEQARSKGLSQLAGSDPARPGELPSLLDRLRRTGGT
ncbi:hypothetical protein M2271_008360 [Streptomyces sp. LBL]|uniref:hypothetical protein n=1 Tax=Streptomyces sp. LBL TaxID=2940562 RepID=UPI002475A3C4|nr:hypothetical protein [Streptomyces sp. LBL]MDH6630499.1 hypothetical protein [Streptomyces sp. LBL]